MSRELLIEAYITALPFAAIAIVQTAGGGCRVETGAPSEAIASAASAPRVGSIGRWRRGSASALAAAVDRDLTGGGFGA
jgi:hypothetical protein